LTFTLTQLLTALGQAQHLAALTGIGRGIERETLRVLPEGKLSYQGHAYSIGSALTHPQITTDYAENLLEFITPVSHEPATAIAQLQDIQKFVLSELNGECLWPLSMPCYVDDEDKIPLAQFGSSNIGRMKTVYRQGLKNRYGSMMQVIAGIHYNFSFSEQFWLSLRQIKQNNDDLQQFKSDGYFALLRNYKRYSWLIPYLYGSSPALCPSFLRGKNPKLAFKTADSGYLYLPYATSLRMSGLGYTNNAQADLRVCYNDVAGYVEGVREAIKKPSSTFAKIGVKVADEYRQLNSNVLQIENELYAPIRPKRVTKSGEKPSDALAERGVEYIEVRSLDVNPYCDTGVTVEQIYFLDVFLTYCALTPSPLFDCTNQQDCCTNNMTQVVVNGRDPQLKLTTEQGEKSILQWGSELFAEFAEVATLLDNAYQTTDYSAAVARELQKIQQPALTPSAIMVRQIEQGEYQPLALAQQYRQQLLARDYQQFDLDYFTTSVQVSHQQQREIEQADTLSFDEFLQQYFSD
jgi:glutamate--cysteine ligase